MKTIQRIIRGTCLWEVAFLYVKFDSSEIDAQFECFFTDIKSKKLLFDNKEMMVKWGGVSYNRIINEIRYDY